MFTNLLYIDSFALFVKMMDRILLILNQVWGIRIE